MAGHSKWKNIQKVKGANDAKRGKLFTKFSKDIEMATRLGENGDPNFNPMLRVIVEKARTANMTKDKIQKAINKGLGITSDDEITYTKTYELYGPGGVAILVDCETDNPNRALTELKVVVYKAEGKLVPEGSISWQFEELGLIELIPSSSKISLDEIMLAAMDWDGIKDVKIEEKEDENEKVVKVLTEKQNLKKISNLAREKLTNIADIVTVSLLKEPKDKIKLSEEDEDKLIDLIGKLEELQDVVNIWHNAKYE